MRDPKPTAILLVVQIGLLAWLALWWLSLTPTTRLSALLRVGVAEEVVLPPPATGLIAQAEWLVQHRLARIPDMAALAILAIMIGGMTGVLHYANDPLGGFRFRAWTTGVCGFAVLPGLLGGSLVVPWPLPLLWVGAGLSSWSGLVAYLLMRGRPYVA